MYFHTLIGWGSAAIFILMHATSARAVEGSPALSPDRAVSLALTAHPDLATAEMALSTAEAARSASRIIASNPTANAWFTPDGSRAEFSIGQPVSLTGAGWHARSSARLSVDSTQAAVARTRREIAASVRLAYIDAVVATGVVDVAREGAELAARLSYAVGRKHDEGEASTLDLRLARLAEVQAATRLLAARKTQADALRGLSALTLTPVMAVDLGSDPLASVPVGLTTPRTERSDLISADAALSASRADLRRARAATIPPVTLGVGMNIEDGTTFVGPSVGVTLPLFDRNQVGRAQAVGAVEVAAGRLASLQAVADTERATSLVRLDEAEAAALVVEGSALDEARAALASIESGVLAGEIDLPTAVLLQTQVIDGEAAVVTLRGLVADARIDRLLALDDNALLGDAQ